MMVDTPFCDYKEPQFYHERNEWNLGFRSGWGLGRPQRLALVTATVMKW